MKKKTRTSRTSRSLTATLALAFLALSAALLLIFGGLQLFSNIATQQVAIADKLRLNALDASLQVSNFIQNKFGIMETAARLTNLAQLPLDQQRQVLDGLLGRDTAFRQVAALNTQGQELAKSSRLSQQASASLAGQLPAEALEYLKEGEPYISSVYVDPLTSEPLVLAVIPSLNALGDFQGALAAEINLKFMWDLIDEIQIGETGSAYVVNKLGDLIAFNDTARVLRGENVANLNEVREFIQGDESGDTTSGELFTGIQGSTVVGTFAPLGTPDWAVVVELPWEEAYREVIQNGLISAVILVIMAALAGLLGVYLARRLSVPLVGLTNTAAKVSAGELGLQADVSGPEEVARLATSFNSMTAQLRGLIGELEDRVQARTEQLRASADVGRAVTSILEPGQLLKQVVELITERFGFYYTAVFVLDDEGQQAVLRAATGEAGQILLERRHRLPVDQQSMVGGAIVTRSARIALDVGQGAVRFANPLLPDTRSEIALPLRAGDRVLGALDVQSKEPGAFDEASADVLQTMADQIAIALLNAEIFNRSEWQARTMAVLNQLSRDLTTATSLEDIAVTVQLAVTSLLGQSRVAIVQKTANPQILALREFSSDPDRPVGPSQPVHTVGSLNGECVEHGEVIYAPDIRQYVDRYSDAADFYQQGQRSSVIVPLRVGERILGTLNVGVDRAEAYSEEQVNQLEQIASQLAITIENLNLAEQTQQTLAELDAANRRLIGQAWGEYTRSTRLEAAEWRNGTWSVLDDRAMQPEASQALVAAAPPLSLPIKVRGTTIGIFNIAAADARQVWDAEDMAFAQSLVDQVGQVLETARLLDETERAALREKAVANAADKIHRSMDIETVLQSAVTELQRITGRRGISVQLGFGRAQQAAGRTSRVEAEGDR